MYFPAWSTAHFTPRSSRLRDASGALDDMSLRKIAVAKRLGKVFCMGIQVCLFEGVHLTSSLSRSDGGDSGGLLKAVSQTDSSHGAATAAARLHDYKTVIKLTCWYLILHFCFNAALHGWFFVHKHNWLWFYCFLYASKHMLLLQHAVQCCKCDEMGNKTYEYFENCTWMIGFVYQFLCLFFNFSF